jgi:hypothetical protein
VITGEANLERNPRCSWIPEARACLKSLEATVVGATAGRTPPEQEWGPIGAREFLNVVHDSIFLCQATALELPPARMCPPLSPRSLGRHHPRWEPDAVMPLVRICEGGGQQCSSLLQLQEYGAASRLARPVARYVAFQRS